jgi:beta-glucosidase
MSYPKDFLWGVAASAFQIEGSTDVDGKGQSIWNMFCKQEGKIWSGHNADRAAEHYYRYKDDISLMKSIGVQAYHFSIDWTRIFPEGIGRPNPKGIDFYNNLIDELLKNNITPFLNIFHWEFPYELYCKGGWLNRDSSEWFAEYTRLLVKEFSDRVRNWITICEPQCFIGEGLVYGESAPGHQLGVTEVLRACHNTLLAHGKAVQVIRAYSKTPCKVSFAPVGVTMIPDTNKHGRHRSSKESMFSKMKICWNNTWWMDPVFFGKYPEETYNYYGSCAPEVKSDDMKVISEPLDFLGLNIYHGQRVRQGENGCPEEVKLYPGAPLTAYRWSIAPECLYWGPKFFYESTVCQYI